jgi:hypothetical protein
VLGALLAVIELPEDDSVQHGEFAEEDEEIEHAFSSAAFSPLSYLFHFLPLSSSSFSLPLLSFE